MNRPSLFLLILGALLILGSVGYWLSSRENANEKEVTSPEATKEPQSVERDTPRTETPPVSPSADTPSDEDTPKPASENREKFESEEETADTNDSVTIEVELEEE